MNKQAIQLILRGAVNKVGNMLYDYGNNIWLASLGGLGQTVLGIYQMSDLITSILFNPFGGVISDRISRRKILLVTDLICAILCLGISFLTSDTWLVAGLIIANIVQAICFAFSRPANKAYVTEVVNKEEIIIYNARLEMVLQIVSVSAPILSFIVLHFTDLRMTLRLDALSFFLAFLLVVSLPDREEPIKIPEKMTVSLVLQDMKEGFLYILYKKDIFFLLVMASAVNFFYAAFNYLLPFSDQLYKTSGVYALILTTGALGAILGSLLARKVKNKMQTLLLALVMSGLGIVLMGQSLPLVFIYMGNFISEGFMAIFNIHFFTQVQTKVEDAYLGRVLSTIYTLAILLMPLATALMTILPSVHVWSLTVIGLGIILLSVTGLGIVHRFFDRKKVENEK